MAQVQDATQEMTALTIAPVQIQYCSVCTWPLEYCEFNPSFNKCKTALQQNDPEAYDKYFANTELTEKQAQTTRKHEAKEQKALEKKMQSKVLIKRCERGKRKYVTAVFGLEIFNIELKPAAKKFANKFATGASVTKNNQGLDEVVVQGDVSDELFDFITEDKFFKSVPEDNIDCIEEKLKKAK